MISNFVSIFLSDFHCRRLHFYSYCMGFNDEFEALAGKSRCEDKIGTKSGKNDRNLFRGNCPLSMQIYAKRKDDIYIYIHLLVNVLQTAKFAIVF